VKGLKCRQVFDSGGCRVVVLEIEDITDRAEEIRDLFFVGK
jgi:hypothetical protein